MSSIQWGNAAEWVGGIATAGAVVFAGISVRIASNANREARAGRAYDEASLVTVQTDVSDSNTPGQVEVVTTVTNGGKRPIRYVELRFVEYHPRLGAVDKKIGWTMFIALAPGSHSTWKLKVDRKVWDRDGPSTGSIPRALFTDSNGIRWDLPFWGILAPAHSPSLLDRLFPPRTPAADPPS